jgi:hypothetical protein
MLLKVNKMSSPSAVYINSVAGRVRLVSPKVVRMETSRGVRYAVMGKDTEGKKRSQFISAEKRAELIARGLPQGTHKVVTKHARAMAKPCKSGKVRDTKTHRCRDPKRTPAAGRKRRGALTAEQRVDAAHKTMAALGMARKSPAVRKVLASAEVRAAAAKTMKALGMSPRTSAGKPKVAKKSASPKAKAYKPCPAGKVRDAKTHRCRAPKRAGAKKSASPKTKAAATRTLAALGL